jgi:type IV secretion system protein VirB9
LRFEYPTDVVNAASKEQRRVESDLASARTMEPRNDDYWYCGDPSLKPIAAWDDGVRTTLSFGARTELPAVFVLNQDGSESLVNSDVQAGRVMVQRVAHRLIVRRGKLSGCIVNRAFTGGGERLASGTITPNVERVTRTAPRRVAP